MNTKSYINPCADPCADPCSGIYAASCVDPCRPLCGNPKDRMLVTEGDSYKVIFSSHKDRARRAREIQCSMRATPRVQQTNLKMLKCKYIEIYEKQMMKVVLKRDQLRKQVNCGKEQFKLDLNNKNMIIQKSKSAMEERGVFQALQTFWRFDLCGERQINCMYKEYYQAWDKDAMALQRAMCGDPKFALLIGTLREHAKLVCNSCGVASVMMYLCEWNDKSVSTGDCRAIIKENVENMMRRLATPDADVCDMYRVASVSRPVRALSYSGPASGTTSPCPRAW